MKVVRLICFLLCSFPMLSAHANSYIEGRVGAVHYSIDSNSFDLDNSSNSPVLSLAVGAFLNPNNENSKFKFGIETGLDYLSQVEIGSLSICQLNTSLLGFLTYELSPKFMLIAKTGMAIVQQEYEWLGTRDNEDAQIKWQFSIGSEYKFSDNYALTLTGNYISGEELNSNTIIFNGHTASTLSVLIGLKYYFS